MFQVTKIKKNSNNNRNKFGLIYNEVQIIKVIVDRLD